MRDRAFAQGMPLVSPDSGAEEGSELSAFASMGLSQPVDWVTDSQLEMSQYQIDLQAYKQSRNGWQRFWDTFQDVANNVAQGALNFVDGLFDAGAYVVGLFGDDEFRRGVQDVMNYDWQAQVMNVGQNLNLANGLLTGDMFTENYWQNWADTGNAAESRKNLDQTGSSSFQSEGEFGSAMQNIEQGIGYVLPSIVVGVLTGGASAGVQAAAAVGMTALTGVSAFGSGANEALNDGAAYEQAGQSGLITGAIEMGTEALSWGVGKIAGKVAAKFGKTVSYGTHVGGASFGQAIGRLSAKELGKAAVEEGTEEFISELLAPLAKQVYKEDAIKKSWSFGTEENAEMWKSAAVSGIAGAVGGMFGSAVSTMAVKRRLTTQGVEAVNIGAEMREMQRSLVEEAQKGQAADQVWIADNQEKLGKLAQQFETKMEALQKSNPKAFKNVMQLFQDPKVFVKNLQAENPTATKQEIDLARKSFMENYKGLSQSLSQDVYELIAQMNSTKDGKIEIGTADMFDLENYEPEWLKEHGVVEGEELKAYHDDATNTSYINPKYKAEFYELTAHENISHGLLDTNIETRRALERSIEADRKLRELFHAHDAELEELYGKQGKETVDSERMATFLENFVKNQSAYDRVMGLESANKLLSILNKIKAQFTFGKNSKFLKQLNQAITKIKANQTERISYKPRPAVQFSKKKVAKPEETDANILKNAAQFTQERYINLNTVEDVYKVMVDYASSLASSDTSITFDSHFDFEHRADKARKTFADFNTLLNDRPALRDALKQSIEDFLDTNITYSYEVTDVDGSTFDVTMEKIPLRTLLERMGENVAEFEQASIDAMEEVLVSKSKETAISKYQTLVKNLMNRISYYRLNSVETIKTIQLYEKLGEKLEKNRMAATKVGADYVPKLAFYKTLLNGQDGRHKIRVSKTAKGISPASVTNLVNNMRTFTQENITALGGVWTTEADVETGRHLGVSNERMVANLTFLESQFKDGKFPNRALTLEETVAVREVLQGIKQDINELVSKEGLARQQATHKGEMEMRAVHQGFVKKDGSRWTAPLRMVETEMDLNSSMGANLAKWFGADSELHQIFFDRPFEALDAQYAQEMRMTNELNGMLQEYKLWDKVGARPSKRLSAKVKLHGFDITIGTLMDIYAEMQTETGLASLQDGGYSWKVNENSQARHVVLTPEDLDFVRDSLTAQEREFVEKAVKELYNGSWKKYKTQSDVKIMGFADVLESEVYYPINRADTKNIVNDAEAFQHLDLSNQSFNKRRVKNAQHLAIRGMDFVQRATAYINGLSKYGEMYQTMKQIDLLLRQRAEGTNQSRQAVFEQNIPGFGKYMDYLTRQIMGVPLESRVGKSGMMGNLVAATLYGNVSVVLKQTGSLPTIMLEVSPRAWLRALVKGSASIAEYGKTKEFIEKNSGIAAKRWANSEAISARTLRENISKFGKVFGWPMEKMDEAVIVMYAWKSAQYQAEIDGAGKVGTDTNNKAALKILNRIIANTQSNAIPMNMSMSRAGAAGYIRKVLSYFTSDLQNKVSRLNQIVYEAKYAKQRLDGVLKMKAEYQAELQKATDAVNKFKAENDPSNAGYAESLEGLELAQRQAQENVDAAEEMERNERTVLSGNRRWAEALKYAVAAALSGLIVAGVDELIKRLYGRKAWTEDTSKDFATNLLAEATIGNLPYVNNILNAIEYNSDVGGYDFTVINSVVDIMKTLKNGIEDGKWNWGILKDALTMIGQAIGIPVGNLYNLISGVWKNIDGSGYRADAVVKGYGQTFITNSYKEALANGNTKAAEGYISLLMTSYKTGSQDEVVNAEISELVADGYSAMPKNYATYYVNDNGERVDYADDQINTFRNYYSQSTQEVASMISKADYRTLNEKSKASVITKVYNAYHDYAKAMMLKQKGPTKLSNLLVVSGGKISVSKYVLAMDKLSTIEATNAKTKKELVVKAINSLRGFSKQEKLVLAYLLGYSVSDANKPSLRAFLRSMGATKTEAEEMIQ